MRTIMLCMILMVAIIGVGLSFQNMLDRESQDLIASLQNIEELVRKDNWEQAGADMLKVSSKWQDTRKKWQAVTDHNQIGIIDESLARLQAFLSEREKKDCFAEIAALRQNICYIPDKEKLTLSNIF